MRRLGLVARLVLAGLAAAIAIVALEWNLRSREAERAAAAGALPAVEPEDPTAATLRAADVVLAAALRELDTADAVWQLLADGGTVLRRPPRPPAGPVRPRLSTVGVLLPARALAALSPEQRAGLLDLLSRLWPERPVAPARLLLRGVDGGEREVASLLAWLR